jgi:alanine racemase
MRYDAAISITLIGATIGVDDLAAAAGTIGYEVR